MEHQLFISHASEDKKIIVEPLIAKLSEHGVSIWYDNFNIELGDSIENTIKSGLKNSNYGVVVLSPDFFKKSWTQKELNELLQKERLGKKSILPILYNIEPDSLKKLLPELSDKAYEKVEVCNGKVVNLDHIVRKIIRVLLNSRYISNDDMSLIEILEKCNSSESNSLRSIGTLLDRYYNILSSDIDMAIVRANMLVECILKDVCKRNFTNIASLNSDSLLDICLLKGFLGSNIETHCKVIKNFAEIALCMDKCTEVVSNEDLNTCQASLKALLNWYMKTYNRNSLVCKNELSVVWPEDFTEDDIKQSYVIETKLFDPNLISPIEIALKWAEHNPYTNLGVRDTVTGRLAGFFCTLPITDNLFKEIASGNYIDTHIPTDDIRKYDPPDFYKLYLCSFCIDPDYQNTKAFKLLSNAFIDMLLKFADDGIYISEMVADAITEKGERLCTHLDMKVINTSTHGSKIYRTTLLPPSLRIMNENAVRLEKFYLELYSKYRDVL